MHSRVVHHHYVRSGSQPLLQHRLDWLHLCRYASPTWCRPHPHSLVQGLRDVPGGPFIPGDPLGPTGPCTPSRPSLPRGPSLPSRPRRTLTLDPDSEWQFSIRCNNSYLYSVSHLVLLLAAAKSRTHQIVAERLISPWLILSVQQPNSLLCWLRLFCFIPFDYITHTGYTIA